MPGMIQSQACPAKFKSFNQADDTYRLGDVDASILLVPSTNNAPSSLLNLSTYDIYDSLLTWRELPGGLAWALKSLLRSCMPLRSR
jgi:hypothetical protein